MKPTTMLYRNLLAMETEEVLRAHPIDGAVLMGGCDKTTPGAADGRLQQELPCIFVPAGPMLNAPLARQDRSAAAATTGSTGTSSAPGNITEAAVAGHGGVDRPLARPLHDHGHRLDDDQRRRGARG